MSVTRNTAFNLSASVVSAGVAFVTVPLYLRQIGEERFGILAIVWLLLGYFGVFDLGISRATTNQISRLRTSSSREMSQVFWSAVALNFLFGAVGGALLYGFGAWLIGFAFKMPLAMRSHVLLCLPWLALAVPLATVSGVFVGVLEGCERFGTVNAIQVAGAAIFQLVPLAVAYLHGPQLEWLIVSALVARASSVVPLLIAAGRAISLTRSCNPSGKLVRELFGYGGWVSVNSILGPFFGSLDRLLIGASIGAAAVTIYTIPYNLVHRLQVVPAALARTLFPRFSGLSRTEAMELARRSVTTLATITVPLAVLGTITMHVFLSLWIGPQFATRASGVGEVLVLGVWMSSLAFVPYVFLQGQMRPRTVALVHLVEAPVFAAAVWVGVHAAGVLGAACAMSVRDVVDALVLLVLGGLLPGVARRIIAAFAWVAAALILVSVQMSSRLEAAAMGGVLVLGSFVWALWTEPFLRDVAPRARLRVIRLITE